MSSPVVSTNELSAPVVNPGASLTWRTVATDADARSVPVTRTVTDAAGNSTVFSATLTVEDPLTYGVPECDDPGVTLVVDAADPTLVHVTVG
jgi:hypothetical protein